MTRATPRQRPALPGVGHVDGASGDDRQQYLGLAIAKHLNPCYSVYMMNWAHSSIKRLV